MITKLNLIAGGVVVLLTAGAFTARLGRKPKADWNAEGWLRLLSGENGVTRTQTSVAAPGTGNRDNRVDSVPQAAEMIGRMGYALYR